MIKVVELPQVQLDDNLRGLNDDGITACKAGFAREWVEALREDMMAAFWEAIQRPGGAVARGPRRWYVEAHPQAFRGFVDLVTHPWVVGIIAADHSEAPDRVLADLVRNEIPLYVKLIRDRRITVQ